MAEVTRSVEVPEAPRFKHDCENCTFLGRCGEDDLYFCPQGAMPTIVARFGDEGPQYTSGMPSLWREPSRAPESLLYGERLARERGLLPL